MEKRPPANLVRDDADNLPPWDEKVKLPDGWTAEKKIEATEPGRVVAAGYSYPVRGYTGSTCPACGLAQMWCPSGVTCPNGHGFGHEECTAPAPSQPVPTGPAPAPSQPVPTGPVPTEAIPQPIVDHETVLAPVLPDHGPTLEPAPDPEPSQPEPEPKPEPEPTPEPEPIRPKRGPRGTRKSKSEESTGDRSPVEAAAPVVPDGSYRREQREAVARRLDELVLGDGYERIIEHVFTIDPWSSYEQLQKQLTLPVPAHAQTKALLFDEVDVAQLRAKEAHQLFISAKETVRRFEHDVVVMAVDMRAQATASLQAEKDAGQRSKQITDADVESRMASMFPDEWRQTEMRKSRAKLMVDHMQRLSDAWKERARDLRSLFDGK